MKRISLAIITASLLLVPAAAFAQVGAETVSNQFTNNASNQYTNNPSNQYTNTPGGGGQVQTVTNPLGVGTFCGLIKAILGAVIQIGIPVAVLFIVFAGFKFVLAMGNPAKLQEARKNLMYTLIGIGIFLGAWLIAMVIANTVNALGAGSNGSSQIISCR